MSKKQTFTFPAGTVEYEHKSGLYSFTAKCGKNGFVYGIPETPVAKEIFTDKGNVSDFARGLIGILTVGMWDSTVFDKLKELSNADMLMPMFLGNYHQCMLENTPWGDREFKMLEQMFTPDAYRFLKNLTAMYVDTGEIVAVSPLHAVEKFKA